jgi:glycosyltransferase involved in cell wall biosynthesis
MGVAPDAAALSARAAAAPPPRTFRVLHVNSALTAGGTDEASVRLVQVLRLMGHQVWLAGPGGSRFGPALAEAGLFCDPALRRSKSRFIFHVARCLRRQRPQIVHAHHGRDYWPTILAVWLAGQPVKIVLSRHLAKSPASWASCHFLLARCDALVAVSDFVARVLREGVYEPGSPDRERRSRPPLRGDKSKIFTAHGGIDTDEFHPMDGAAMREQWKVGAEHYVFAVAGAYDKPRGKGQRDFLLAAARIHQQCPNARFLLIGRGSLADTLREDIVQLGLTQKAWLTPYCADMPLAMNALDCLVHPAVGTEAFPLVIGEALACGRPVIASDLDGIPETLIDAESASLVPPGSVEKLAEAMLRWARQDRWDLARRRQLHEKVAARFSLAAAGERMCRIYANVAE